MIRKHSILLAAFALAACASPATPIPQPTDPPPTVAVATQAEPTSAPPATTAPEPSATAEPAPQGDVRVYKIVPAESVVSYSVGEVFINQGNKFNVAVGVTSVIEGEVLLNFAHPEQSTVGVITVDISAFKSDSGRRDNAIRDRWLESSRYPIATFTPTTITGIPAEAKEGDEIAFQITGDLLIRDTTRPTTFDVTAKLEGETLSGAAATTILMSDFNFDAPDIAGILKAENEAKLEFKFVARP